MSVYRKATIIAVTAALGLGTVGVKLARAADTKADAKAGDVDIGDIMKKAFKGAGGPPGGGPGGGRRGNNPPPNGGGGAPGAQGGGPKKPSLVQKAIEGNASADEVKSLLGYCQELTKAKPPKGDQKDWDDRTGKLLTAVETISKGDKSGQQQLKAAANCKGCHELHKES